MRMLADEYAENVRLGIGGKGNGLPEVPWYDICKDVTYTDAVADLAFLTGTSAVNVILGVPVVNGVGAIF